MPPKRISYKKIKGIITLYATSGLNKSQLARIFKVSRSTAREYLSVYNNSDLSFTDVIGFPGRKFVQALFKINQKPLHAHRHSYLIAHFPIIHEQLESVSSTLKGNWEKYKESEPSGYKYSQFVDLYHKWRAENGFPKVQYNKWKIPIIPEEDMKVFKEWRLSSERGKWERAVALIELNRGNNITRISRKIERSCRTIRKWHSVYTSKGIGHLDLRKTRKIDNRITNNTVRKKERLIQLIHEPPSLHDINRTSWSLLSLANAYEKLYSGRISKSSISEYVRAEGYTFKKARKVLTSPDPEYRTKLKRITAILSNLGLKEKFFSIDEFGPVAIKIKGGSALVHKDQIRTIPQRQKSKGSLICTAALELSTNQVTHFYSDTKDTDEMLKLLEILLCRYQNEECIFFSWDAASWHASKKLYERVEKVNAQDYRKKHSNPFVELVPLPIGSQFLNVIESVFSGMAKAIIHNSDYQSVLECKVAIDRYFAERNQAYLENPKRAGKKIWGEEIVKPVFKESNNCKDPNWR